MSKYGPAWVWPAAGRALDKPLPSQPTAEGRELVQQHSRLPSPAKALGVLGTVSEHILWSPRQPGPARSTARLPGRGGCGHSLRKRKNQMPRALGNPPRPGIYPTMPEGSDATLIHRAALLIRVSGEGDRD